MACAAAGGYPVPGYQPANAVGDQLPEEFVETAAGDLYDGYA